MMLFLLSLTGIPPTIGFLGKYYVFISAVNSGLWWLAVIGALNSAIAAFYYLRIIWLMYFEEPRAARIQKQSHYLDLDACGSRNRRAGLLRRILADYRRCAAVAAYSRGCAHRRRLIGGPSCQRGTKLSVVSC